LTGWCSTGVLLLGNTNAALGEITFVGLPRVIHTNNSLPFAQAVLYE
jgi:hypothetical protein